MRRLVLAHVSHVSAVDIPHPFPYLWPCFVALLPDVSHWPGNEPNCWKPVGKKSAARRFVLCKSLVFNAGGVTEPSLMYMTRNCSGESARSCRDLQDVAEQQAPQTTGSTKLHEDAPG